MGRDGRVWRACSLQGVACVVKFPRGRSVESLQDEAQRFNRCLRAALPGLPSSMEAHCRVLGGRVCLVMPFAAPVSREEYVDCAVSAATLAVKAGLMHQDLEQRHVRKLAVAPSTCALLGVEERTEVALLIDWTAAEEIGPGRRHRREALHHSVHELCLGLQLSEASVLALRVPSPDQKRAAPLRQRSRSAAKSKPKPKPKSRLRTMPVGVAPRRTATKSRSRRKLKGKPAAAAATRSIKRRTTARPRAQKGAQPRRPHASSTLHRARRTPLQVSSANGRQRAKAGLRSVRLKGTGTAPTVGLSASCTVGIHKQTVRKKDNIASAKRRVTRGRKKGTTTLAQRRWVR